MSSQRDPRFFTDLFTRSLVAGSVSVPALALTSENIRRTLSDTNILSLNSDNRGRVSTGGVAVSCYTNPAAGRAKSASIEVHVESRHKRVARVLRTFERRMRQKLRKALGRSRDRRREVHDRLHKILKAEKGLVSFPRFEAQADVDSE